MAKGKALGAGAVLGAIGATYKVGEFFVKTRRLLDVGEENAVFERLILRVRRDLFELRRLLSLPEVQQHLARLPEKAAWIERIARDQADALEEMAGYTRNVSEDTKHGGSVGIRNRIRWVLDEQEGLTHRRLEVDTCHQTLVVALDYLSPLERPGRAGAVRFQQQQQQQLPQREGQLRLEAGHRPGVHVQGQWQQQGRLPAGAAVGYREEVRRVGGPGREERPGGYAERVEVVERGPGREEKPGAYKERVEVVERRGPGRNESGATQYEQVTYRESDSDYYPDPRPMRLRTSKL